MLFGTLGTVLAKHPVRYDHPPLVVVFECIHLYNNLYFKMLHSYISFGLLNMNFSHSSTSILEATKKTTSSRSIREQQRHTVRSTSLLIREGPFSLLELSCLDSTLVYAAGRR